MSYLKGKGQNLLISNSVSGSKFPASQLSKPNVHQFLIPVHLPTPVLPKRISFSSYGKNKNMSKHDIIIIIFKWCVYKVYLIVMIPNLKS